MGQPWDTQSTDECRPGMARIHESRFRDVFPLADVSKEKVKTLEAV